MRLDRRKLLSGICFLPILWLTGARRGTGDTLAAVNVRGAACSAEPCYLNAVSGGDVSYSHVQKEGTLLPEGVTAHFDPTGNYAEFRWDRPFEINFVTQGTDNFRGIRCTSEMYGKNDPARVAELEGVREHARGYARRAEFPLLAHRPVMTWELIEVTLS